MGKIQTIILHCVNSFVPLRKKRKNRRNPWITREIVRLKRKIGRQRKVKNREKISNLSSQLRTKLRQEKQKYYEETLTNFMVSSPQKFWRHLSQTAQSQYSIVVDDEIITDCSKIASYHNKFFQSVFSNDSKSSASSTATSFSHTSDMPEIRISYEGILSLLLNIKEHKSVGPDGIPNAFLRRYAEWVARYLEIIFNASLQQKRVPDDWLVAKVIPVHKTGDKQNIENYRPISLTCVCCKLLEHVISKAIYQYLENTNLLHSNQHGFRQKLSTVTQLLETIQDFSKAIDNEKQVDAICLDFAKAFDRVPHNELIMKLKQVGINNNVVEWVRSYLTCRTQYVDINGYKSDRLLVTSGVPQGSVLGPVLFLVYINDICSDINQNITVRLFADDCLLYREICNHNDQKMLSDALASIEKWCETWKMQINKEKTVVLRVTNKVKHVQHFEYKLSSTALATVNKCKYLGVTISEDLNWTQHITNICSTAEKKLWFLRRKLKLAPAPVKLTAYLTIVRPTLEYASIIWDPHQKGLIKKIERVQRRAARFILSKYSRNASVTQMLQELNLQPLLDRRRMARLKFLFLLSQNTFNFDAKQYLIPLQMRSLRSDHPRKYIVPQCRLNTYAYSFYPRTIKDWNALPDAIRDSQTAEHFENNITKYFLSESF